MHSARTAQCEQLDVGPQSPHTYVVGYVAHESSSQLQKQLLQVQSLTLLYRCIELLLGHFCQRGEHVFDESLQVGVAEETESSFALDFPQMAIGIDDTIA